MGQMTSRFIVTAVLTCCAVAAGLMCNVAFMVVPLLEEISPPARPARKPATVVAVGLLLTTIAVGVVAASLT